MIENKLSKYLIRTTVFITAMTASAIDLSQSTPFPFKTRLVEPNSSVDCSPMNKMNFESSEITEEHRIFVSSDGHLEANGKRIRIFGTNISSIPSKQDAAYWAQVLSSQGYNCIRFHHLDADWSSAFLKRNSSGKDVIDTEKLDNFDYFFAELKKVGIYSDINMLTGRNITSADGYPKELDSIQDWKVRHAYGFWSENGRAPQKWYADSILTHFNPYTKTKYTEDPAVAFVEINNENGLLQSYLLGSVDKYPASCTKDLEDKWNKWLLEKNLTFEDLCTKFNRSTTKGAYLISSKKGESYSGAGWNLENHETASSILTKKGDVVSVKVNKNGSQGWHIQLDHCSWPIKSNTLYTLTFKARSSKPHDINVSIMMNHDPWSNLNFSKKISLTEKWNTYTYTITSVSDEPKARLTFGDMGLAEGITFEYSDVSLCEGGVANAVREGYKKNTASIVTLEESSGVPSEYKHLYLNFLYDTEIEYWRNMRAYIKETLDTQALIFGTISSTSTTGIVQEFDVIDSHAYWYHPSFPGKDWDMGNYNIGNYSLVSSETGGTLTELASQRVYGKPFSVTEYDHPFPNQYSAESLPMLSSFACLQDWDCIFTFAFELKQKGEKKGTSGNVRISGYFDQTNNPAKAAACTVASRIFRNELVSPANKSVYTTVTRSKERDSLLNSRAWSTIPKNLLCIPKLTAIAHQVGIIWGEAEEDCQKQLTSDKYVSYDQNADEAKKLSQAVISATGITSDTNQIFWNPKKNTFIMQSGKAFASVQSSPSNEDILTFGQSKTASSIKNNGLAFISFSPTDDFSVVSGVEAGNDKYMIFSCSWSGNLYSNIREYKTKQSGKIKKFDVIRKNVNLTTDMTLGRSPASALASEGVLCVKSTSENGLGRLFRLYKLNQDGSRSDEITGLSTLSAEPVTQFNLSRNDGTLWYELEIIRPQN